MPLTSKLEPQFWEVVKRDYCDYYFFIYDWLLQKDSTQIFLAFESNSIAGLMLVYDGSIIQLRGGRRAVEFMLDNLKIDSVDAQVPADCEDLLLKKYPKPKLQAHVTLINIHKGQEQLKTATKPEPLGFTDADAIAQLMHECYPEMWGDISAVNIKALMSAKEALWLGVKVEGELAAFGYAMLTPKVCHVTWIATSPRNERKGYATSIVSSLVWECFRKSEEAIIYVMDCNNVAKGIYSKVGFKPYKAYFFEKA